MQTAEQMDVLARTDVRTVACQSDVSKQRDSADCEQRLDCESCEATEQSILLRCIKK